MQELLIRLQELHCCRERVLQNPQLTNSEKAVLCSHKRLVRECLPAEVLEQYDLLRLVEPELLECPEIFAMAVLVSTWRGLSSSKRQKLLTHFARPLYSSDKGSSPRRKRILQRHQKDGRRFQGVSVNPVPEQGPH